MNQYTVIDVVRALEREFPLASQDTWDNSGLLVGNPQEPLRGIMFSLDISEEVVDQAIEKGCNVVVSHHPIMFRGVKRLTGANAEQRIIMKALAHSVSLIAFHTPADKNVSLGTSATIGRMLELADTRVLVPDEGKLHKVVVYVPQAQAQAVRDAMAEAGAGHLGNYDSCSWSTMGNGAFRAMPGANPYCGEVGTLHHEAEERIEVICPQHITARVVSAARSAHPYEEPAIDILPTANTSDTCGYGIVGHLAQPLTASQFVSLIKEKVGCQVVRHNAWDRPIGTVAICTGSGSEFVGNAIAAHADAYVTADMKYHQISDATGRIMVADIGHYESEVCTKMIFHDVLTRNLYNFARYEYASESNPVLYD